MMPAVRTVGGTTERKMLFLSLQHRYKSPLTVKTSARKPFQKILADVVMVNKPMMPLTIYYYIHFAQDELME